MKSFSEQEHIAWIKNAPKRISSSGVILEDDDGKLLIIKANYKSYWTIPGGIIDEGETPKRAAIREVHEEVGIRLNEDDLTFVLVADRISDYLQTYQFVFKTKLTEEAKNHIVLQTSEIDTYAFVTKSQVESGDRGYAKSIYQWAGNITGYVEQVFEG